MCVNWSNATLATGATNNILLTNTREFIRFADYHQRVKPIGVKMELLPSRMFGSDPNGNNYGVIEGVHVASRSGELPNAGMTVAEMRTTDDYQLKKWGYIKKYVNVAKYHKKRGFEWVDVIKTIVPTFDMGTPNMGTLFKFYYSNL